ncbi:MAG: hypothetical protein HC875_05830, partial [Anaerolineales bacterium]|nr:hypothetical protein [Anaerolineales bacterium]
QRYQRLLAMYNAPDFIIYRSVMIICKSNMRELADNLQKAIDYDIGLNLSPVVVYPVLEQLNVFEDFAVETQGWQDALDQAEA